MSLLGAEIPDGTQASTFKRQVFYALESPRLGGRAAKVFSAIIFLLIIANVVLVFTEIEIVPEGDAYAVLTIFDVFSLAFFSLEYVLRVWTADLLHPQMKPLRARLHYMCSPMGLVDLLAVLPSFFPFLFKVDARIVKSIRLIRLVRLVKITRYMDGIASIERVLHDRAHQIISALFVLVLLLIVSAVLMYQVEHAAQPDIFDSVFTGLYWAMVTITTTGYGDIVPITPWGRIFGFIIMGLSIGVVAIPAGILSAGFVEESRRMQRRHPLRKSNPVDTDDAANPVHNFCPYCGHSLEEPDSEDVRFCAFCGHELKLKA